MIATAVRLPSVFDFDPLFKLDAVIAVKDHELFSLLQVFLNGSLSDFTTWESSHSAAFETYSKCHQYIILMARWRFADEDCIELDKKELERKIRLLTLASIAFKNVGQDLPYAEIASALQVDPSEVEKWAIDGEIFPLPIHKRTLTANNPLYFTVIRAGLVSGKLSQTTQTLHITRSTARVFEREQWEALEKRLVAWKAGLGSVLEVVATARTSASRRATAEQKDGTALEAGRREVAAT